jgi:hypothetical protein
MGDDPLHRDADLAGVDVAAGGDRAGRLLQVGVGQHDHRARGAQLQRQLFHPGHAGDALAGGGRAGEGDLAHAWVADQGVAERAARAGEDGQHPLGQAGVDEASG